VKQDRRVMGIVFCSTVTIFSGCGGENQGSSETAETRTAGLAPGTADALDANVIDVADVKDVSEYMYPPGTGYLMHKSCVHEVPDGASIRHGANGRVEVVSKGGDIVTYGRCTHAMVRVGSAVSSGQPPSSNTGWNTWSSAFAPTGPTGHDWFSAIGGDWTVPPDPSVDFVGGLIYLFNSLQSASEIIQPVLQFGNNGTFGGNSWTLASWHVYVDQGGGAYYSPVLNTSEGSSIHGFTVSNGCSSSGLCNWEIDTTDNTSGHTTTMFISAGTGANTVAERFTRADQAVLEAYGISFCAQYPSGSTQFQNTTLYQLSPSLLTGVEMYTSASWFTGVGSDMTCGQTTSLGTRGATITY